MPELIDAPPTGGLNQSIGEPHRPNTDLLLALNVRQLKTGAAEKRPGNVHLGAAANTSSQGPYGLVALSDDILLCTTPVGTNPSTYYSCNSYSPAIAALGNAAITGNRVGAEAFISRKCIDVVGDADASETQSALALKQTPAMAYSNGLYFYTEVEVSNPVAANACILTIEDRSTGTSVVSKSIPLANVDYAMPVVANGKLIIVNREHGSPNIAASSMDLSNIAAGFTAGATLRTDGGTPTQFDVVPNGTGFTISYADNAGHLVVANFSSALSQTAANTVSIASLRYVSMAIGNGIIATSYTTQPGAGSAVVGVTTWTTGLAAGLAPTTLFSEAVGSGDGAISCGCCIVDATHVFVAGALATGTNRIPYVTSTQVSTSGVLTGNIAKTYWAVLASRPWTYNGLFYAWLTQVAAPPNGTETQGKTHILCEFVGMSSGLLGVGSGTRPVASSCNRFAARCQQTVADGLATPFPMSVVSPSSGVFEVIHSYLESVSMGLFARGTADFTSPFRWSPATLGALVHLNSGPTGYDHATMFEAGFHTVQPLVINDSGAAGGFAAGTYYASYCYSWNDAAGNVHRSAPSVPQSAIITASHGITFTIPCTQLTYRQVNQAGLSAFDGRAITLEIYLSTNNPAVANGVTIPMNLVSSTTFNSMTAPTVSVTLASPTVQNGQFLYTLGGVLPNVAPPSFKAICSHKSRIFGIADDGTTIYFSKQFVAGEAVNFCDGMTLEFDDVVNLTALTSMDANLIIFSDQSIYYLVGNGPGDNGQNSDYDIPARIASDVGCINPRSIVLTPAGILFQSRIGIYLLDRGLNVSFIGQPIVDDLGSNQIVGAALHPIHPWVYFQLNDGTYSTAGNRLVYDYRVEKWVTDTWNIDVVGVPTNIARTSSALYFSTQGHLWQEDLTGLVNTDSGAWVTADVEWGWTHPAGIQGFQNTITCTVLGQRLSPHDVRVRARSGYGSDYDVDMTWTDPQISGQSRSPTEQFQLTIEKEHQAVTVRFTDYPPTNNSIGSGQGCRIYGITMEVEPLTSSFRVSPAQQGG